MAVTIRPLAESDLSRAEEIVRLAFGTFLHVPDPDALWAGREYGRPRWLVDPGASFAAEIDGKLVGTNFAACWGSFGFFGPLTVHPDFWDRGVGKELMPPVIECFRERGVRHAGLFTFPHSPKHLGLYQKFGFWPRFLTAVMSKPIEARRDGGAGSCYSEVAGDAREACLQSCQRITEAIFEGMDLSREIRAVTQQGFGDTALVYEGETLVGFAVCHCGPGTEAGEGKCLVKFGAVQPGPAAERNFVRLMESCEALGARHGLQKLQAGVSMGRHEAYRCMLEIGFRTEIQGVAMHCPNETGYNRPGVFAVDDWR